MDPSETDAEKEYLSREVERLRAMISDLRSTLTRTQAELEAAINKSDGDMAILSEAAATLRGVAGLKSVIFLPDTTPGQKLAITFQAALATVAEQKRLAIKRDHAAYHDKVAALRAERRAKAWLDQARKWKRIARERLEVRAAWCGPQAQGARDTVLKRWRSSERPYLMMMWRHLDQVKQECDTFEERLENVRTENARLRAENAQLSALSAPTPAPGATLPKLARALLRGFF